MREPELIISSNIYYSRFKNLPDDELVNIVFVEPGNFDNEAVEAAKSEILIRHIDEETISFYISTRLDINLKLQEIRLKRSKNKWLPILSFFLPHGHILGILVEAYLNRKQNRE